jgi:hypothetical protein
MKGAITSKEDRSDGNILLFDVNENDYRPEVARILTRNQALNGTMLITDWGYPESNRRITIGNLYMSQSDYETLVGIKEDSNHTFHFHYRNSSWHVVVQRVEGFPEGNLRNTNMYLQVVSKIADGETS